MDGVTCVQVWRCVWRLSTSKELTRFSWSDQIRHFFNPPAPNMSSDFFFLLPLPCQVSLCGRVSRVWSCTRCFPKRRRLETLDVRSESFFTGRNGVVTPVKTWGAFKIVKGNCQLLKWTWVLLLLQCFMIYQNLVIIICTIYIEFINILRIPYTHYTSYIIH